ncbi:guanyl-specific ribonuclease F1 [Metarhizium album ARSEF 1941]|uniref:ribonuclease T1 n=1 Tax=Metarhizium album (strain ARSEF 1941) TaxID=1081103 RepID=A0A0B2WSV2_METAS|nr:guanyl-specific ribonuclease F1 [Metarhizium album ARSEF 1941]KHN96694.1 guanyl-specific ribonuclease F1 [Metarhizium album ARSEF 1941]
MRLSFAFFLSLIALAVCDTANCGGANYTPRHLQKAVSAACSLLQERKTVGRNEYPHKYQNHEKIELTGPPPYFEFPLLPYGEIYSGDAPGPDRVIITKDCKLAGAITHTGSSRNGFVTCDVKRSPASVLVLNGQSVFALCFTMMLYAAVA